MKARRSRSQTAKVSHSRWLAYATASAATAIAGSNSAEAAIHYSGPLRVQLKWDLGDCGESFIMTRAFQLDQPGDSLRLNRYLNTYCRGIDFCTIFGLVSAAFRAQGGSYSIPYLSRLRAGQT